MTDGLRIQSLAPVSRLAPGRYDLVGPTGQIYREISQAEAKRSTDWWAGQRVIARHPMEAGSPSSVRIEPGARLDVQRAFVFGGVFRRLAVSTQPCPCCGVSVTVRVPLSALAWPVDDGDDR